MQKVLLRAFVLFGLSLVFLWPAVMNRGPFYFVDTRTYMRTEDAALSKLLHRHTDWTAQDSASAPPSYMPLHNAGDAHARSLSQIKEKGIMMGRSLVWGLLPYLGWKSGFWLTIFLQSISLVLLLWLCLDTLKLPVWDSILWVGLALALLSDAGFYTSYLMPDLYAGFAVVALAVLLSAGAALSRRQSLLWFALLLWCLLCHDSLLVLDAGCLLLGVLANVFTRRWTNRRGLVILAACLCLALGFQQGVRLGIRHIAGQEPLRFPILTARLIEDGPGTQYLKKTCPASGFAVCAYVDKFPMNSQKFLYCAEPSCAVYDVAGYETRRRISNEQLRLFFEVLRDDPAAVGKADLKNTWKALSDLSMGPFHYGNGIKTVMDTTFPASALAQIHAGVAYRGDWPVGFATAFCYLFTVASFVYVARLILAREPLPLLSSIGRWCCVCLLLNAAICGCLSDASEMNSRYQGRVVWVLPLLVLLAEAARRSAARAAIPVPSQLP